METKREEHADLLEEALDAYLDGAPLDRGLALVGAQAVSNVQDTIRDLDDPPNAPSTIAAKGADNPLIDTGRMRQSITYVVESD